MKRRKFAKRNLAVRLTAILVLCALAASSAVAADITWDEPAVAIPTEGNAIVRTDGTLVEAINFTPAGTGGVLNVPRTVNGVTFSPQLTGPTGWNDPVFDTSIYTGGGVSGDFPPILDSFTFGDTPANPGTETLTLGTFESLIAGNQYLVQLFVSDDRTAALRSRTQDYLGGGNLSDPYANGFSYSLTGSFIADAATQDIVVRAFPGTGQTSASPIINAFQVRQVPEPSTLLLMGMAFCVMALTRRLWANHTVTAGR